MCTAVTYHTKDHYFGRNFDLEYSYHETVVITPRNFPFSFRKAGEEKHHYAMIGMAYVAEDYPLYYDAMNEKGLAIAGLNFPDNAVYHEEDPSRINLGSFELIPYLLCRCANLQEAREELEKINIAKIDFSEQLPASPLHWIVADKTGSLTIESVKDGLKIYENPVGILTNNPPFDIQMFQLNHYMSLSTEPAENHLSPALDLKPYSRGMGALGLPGDLSSASRFVKAAFTKLHSLSGESEAESISQFFHILGSVCQQRGCVHMGEGNYEITIYSSCCNLEKGIYYYRTYENSQITAVELWKEDVDGTKCISYELRTGQQIFWQQQA